VFPAAKAGTLYAIIVFLGGFILGTIRVLLLIPRLGETTAVILEAPVMLAAGWFVCRWCVDRLDVRPMVPARSLMGLVGFLVLMSDEFRLGALFGRSLVNQLPAYRSLPGAIGLAAQVIFAVRVDPQRDAGAVRPAQRPAAVDRDIGEGTVAARRHGGAPEGGGGLFAIE
jgi:hypothetical protein